MPPAFITLTTDFGLTDPYVASMKGAIYTINPEATIVDISHDIAAHRIEQATFVLGCAAPYFPKGSIHVAVVDPDVGTDRRALAIVTEDDIYVGPDNGVLSCALPDGAREAAGNTTGTVRLPKGMRAFELTKSRFHRTRVSATFHGRDVFAPVAARLSLGVSLSELGPETGEIVAFRPIRGEDAEGGGLRGHVVHIDRFGNAVTSIRGDQLPSPELTVEAAGRSIGGVLQTYADAEGFLALVGSCGFLEIALNGGHAAGELGVKLGDSVMIRASSRV
ncbi:MAG TPA: SAM-dependent chlorinase/fluorinase [Dehalococcoidia bacterium]|nr:SAM-dependent chlorinase/fluorinase [Dehalococcoidia bacterium]